MKDSDRKNRYLHQSRGQWQVNRERLHIVREEPDHPDAGAHPLGDYVDALLGSFHLDTHTRLAQIAADWPEIVGAPLSRLTSPAHLEDGLLTIHLRHPALKFELQGPMQKQILQLLQTRYGPSTVRRLRLIVA